MKAKTILTIVLLVFVGASIVALAARGLRQQPGGPPDTITDGLVVYYFHGSMRCPTCRKIESYAHEAIKTGFGAELDSGDLQWKVVNYEASGNEHFGEDYEVTAPTVVLVEMRGGEQKRWKNLDRVWELVMTGTKEEFLGYVQEEAKALLGGSAS